MTIPRLFAERGQRFGRGVVTEPEIRVVQPSRPRGVRGAELLCDCGSPYRVSLSDLFSGKTRSCGCLYKEVWARVGVTHGLSDHPLYKTHLNMMNRCHDEQHPTFKHYGGRGITVYPEWHDVTAFIAWIEANIGPRPDGCSFDRWPDNDGNYEPGNVRWATDLEQHRNTRPALKDRCSAGHLRNEENTRRDKNGRRYCRACNRERARQRRQANRIGRAA